MNLFRKHLARVTASNLHSLIKNSVSTILKAVESKMIDRLAWMLTLFNTFLGQYWYQRQLRDYSSNESEKKMQDKRKLCWNNSSRYSVRRNSSSSSSITSQAFPSCSFTVRTSKMVDLVRCFWPSSPNGALHVMDGVDFLELWASMAFKEERGQKKFVI